MANGLELRKINRNLVYRTLIGAEEMTKQEIARSTGLSLPTVSQNLQDLMSDGLVSETGMQESTGGRRATGFCCVRDARYAVGIDLTQNHMTIAVVNIASEVVCISGREMFRFADRDSCYDAIAGKVRTLLEANQIAQERILGVGVSLPCIVDRAENRVTYSKIIDAPVDLARRLKKRLPFRVEVFNDANSAGYAEMGQKQDGTRDGRMLFYLMLSNSVGGAMIYGEDIYLGDSSRSAEVGHIKIVPDGRPCYCGQKGCANAYCSAKLLADQTGGELEQFFEELQNGNAQFREQLSEYLGYLAITVVNLRMLYDCEIILGGYVGAQLAPYMDELRDLAAELDPYADRITYLSQCEYLHEASAVGAAMSFTGAFIEDL